MEVDEFRILACTITKDLGEEAGDMSHLIADREPVFLHQAREGAKRQMVPFT